ncbi:hypothetical protein DINM_006579 [Dirofilaria immitis]|nr:hypothetical protein [Dirofilaria immitis]
MTRNASKSSKDLGFEEKKKLCCCFRCNLDLTSTKTVSCRLSMPKKKPIQLIAVCKGCGAEMKAGTLVTVEYKKQRMQMSSDQILRRESQKFSGQSAFSSPFTEIVEKKISSSSRRRKLASKLQCILASQTPTRKETSLQDFLEVFKVNI